MGGRDGRDGRRREYRGREREERSRIKIYCDNESKFIVCAIVVSFDGLGMLRYERMENVWYEKRCYQCRRDVGLKIWFPYAVTEKGGFFFELTTVGETVALCTTPGRSPMNADRLEVYMWFDLRKKESRSELRDLHQEEIWSDWYFCVLVCGWRHRLSLVRYSD